MKNRACFITVVSLLCPATNNVLFSGLCSSDKRVLCFLILFYYKLPFHFFSHVFCNQIYLVWSLFWQAFKFAVLFIYLHFSVSLMCFCAAICTKVNIVQLTFYQLGSWKPFNEFSWFVFLFYIKNKYFLSMFFFF